MGSISLLSLATISQYSLFLGIALILFGWFEKKEQLAYAGQAVFILLGIFSVWLLSTTNLNQSDVNNSVPTKELKVLSYLKMSAWFAGLTLISLLLGLFKNRFYRSVLFILIVAALGLFFVVFNILQMPSN